MPCTFPMPRIISWTTFAWNCNVLNACVSLSSRFWMSVQGFGRVQEPTKVLLDTCLWWQVDGHTFFVEEARWRAKLTRTWSYALFCRITRNIVNKACISVLCNIWEVVNGDSGWIRLLLEVAGLFLLVVLQHLFNREQWRKHVGRNIPSFRTLGQAIKGQTPVWYTKDYQEHE